MSFRYPSGINKPGFNPLAAGSDQYKGIWNLSSQANAKAANTWPSPPLQGELWGWGSGGDGRLGLGNTTSYSSPKQVGSLNNWAVVDGGTQETASIKVDGTLWAWGYNGYG